MRPVPEKAAASRHAPSSGAGSAEPGTPTVLQVLRRLDCGTRGLTEPEAEERLARWGPNTVPAHRGPSWPRLFARGLRDPFTAVLLCVGLVSAVVASWGTACVVLALVAVSGALRAHGECRADRSLAALRALVVTTATVLRRADGESAPVEREIPVDELVPGDVIRLGPGDPVPADVRLLRSHGLSVHQAELTGESSPVPKDAADSATPEGGGPFDRPQLCFQGSGVASGSGTAVVVETGERTRFAAARALAAARRGPSAFDTCVHGVSWALVRFMLLVPPLVLLADAALRGPGLATVPFAVAVAVAVVPEMLPVVVTTCLARGASALARTRGVLVRRLPALHDLGAVDVLCLDKTGTLTQDRPTVDGALDAEGRHDPEVLHWAAVNAWWTLQLADLPAPDALDEAVLDAADAGGVYEGDSAPGVGGAVLGAAYECDLEAYEGLAPEAYECDLAAYEGRAAYERDPEAVEGLAPEAYEGVAAQPFDPVRRLAVAVVRTPGRIGTHTVVVKGAPEAVLERCATTGPERRRLLALGARQAERGLRVLAVATAERPARLSRALAPGDPRGLTFRGFVTLRDAVAPTAAGALAALADRGVAVKILTGDHPGTALRACRDLGMPVDADRVLTADHVDGLGDRELAEAAGRTTVFARCAPEHKARIAAALRTGGHTVGFLGDGVNDLPALRVADVGISPRDAVPAVRETADVVLADRDLGNLGHAVDAGRRSSANVTTYLRVSLSANLGNAVAVLVVGLLTSFPPMLPALVLVQNLCFDAAQVSFASDRPHPAVLRRPAAPDARALLRFVTGFGALNAAADLATLAVLALAPHGPGGTAAFHSGWFTENLLTQALVMVLLRTGRRTARGRTPGPVGWAALALAATGVVLPLTPLGPPLALTALPVHCYLLLGAVLAGYAAVLTVLRGRGAAGAGTPPDGAGGGGRAGRRRGAAV
ncbi:cation-translocating P-type ATPase [Streptomyces tirandamycinicus]|uniref:Magnesium-translocating P-type ATPase n=1 Tax=Streptomyces tirandamycinicus TaxID=2174846 RepID=A0A2S1STC6_9ACTN|nr:HAD-IC family P-type ATPase [Streptomyces tirandamycinicus]AWI29638.1 magnesium-translocating P-type ATPase [Streptomyces tirandamycinicus]